MCLSNPFAALHRAVGGTADRLTVAEQIGRAEAAERRAWVARVHGWHAMADAALEPASDQGEQFSDWGAHRAAEVALELRAQLAAELLAWAEHAEAQAHIEGIAARMGWTWRKRVQWDTLRRVADRKSESQRLDDVRLTRADAGATRLNKEQRAVMRRLKTNKRNAAEMAAR